MKISQSIEIESTAAVVYETLTDLSSYEDWHPSVSVKGAELKKGSDIILVIEVSGKKILQKVRVSRLESNKMLEWYGGPFKNSWLQPFFSVHHSFQIESINSNRVRMTNQEVFGGFFLPFIFPLKKTFEKRYHQVNLALKSICESTEVQETPSRLGDQEIQRL